jgi:hypothetical protein
MQPPTTSYPHGYSGNQHGSSTSVKSHFLLSIPGWAVKTCHCTCHAKHYSATKPPSSGNTTSIVPRNFWDSALSIPYRPTLTRPRPSLDQPPVNKEARHACHRIRGLFTVSSSTSPWCPGMAGHSRSTSLQRLPQRSIKLHL